MTTKAVDSSHKVLIFSDTHLTDRFDQPKFNYLKNLIESANLVIINGDFWDYYLTTWDQFLESEWKQLFPILKAKNAIYIFGNHDQQIHSDHRINLFSSEQGYAFKLTIGERILNIQHGHLIVPSLELQFPSLRKRFLIRLASKLEEKNVFLLGLPLTYRSSKKQNKRMRAFVERSIPEGELLICGHSHLVEHEEGSRYINTGWIRYGQAQAIQIQDGVFTFINTKY